MEYMPMMKPGSAAWEKNAAASVRIVSFTLPQRTLVAFLVCLALPAQPIRIMSLNIAGNSKVDAIAEEIKQKTGGIPDVLLLQEAPNEAQELGKKLDLNVEFAAPKPGRTNVGIAILSRWQMTDRSVHRVKRFYRLLKIRPRMALGVTVLTPSGPMRVWTTHLDTRINIDERLEQLRPIVTEAAKFDGPAVIGGDSNTLGLGWILHSIPFPRGDAHARAVERLMKQHGFHTPFQEDRATFDLFGMRLDWIYVRGLEPLRTGIQPLEASDHHAIWTDTSDTNRNRTVEQSQ
jgi:endonuclease/exonuclease/phosphatase (EEP) superfamily protein YafD